MSEEELLAKNYRKYWGKDLDVYFNLSMCTHAAICVRQLPQVFNVRKKPWIMVDNASVEEVKRICDLCPSDALKYIEKENNE